jgi:putative transposase
VPWNETCPMELREKFIADWKKQEVPIVGLCEAYGISRKTGYKWIDRYHLEGVAALGDRSRAPHSSPQVIDGEVAEAFIGLRKQHPFWGPRKLLGWMAKFRPTVPRPAASTIGDLLKREGLVLERHRRHRLPSVTQPFADIEAPNDTWCTDFKGQFRVGSGQYCYPLTLTDAYSRFLIRCTALPSVASDQAQQVFASAFSEYGLPNVIRSDNGSPFGAPGAGPASLSRLSVYFVKLGIRPEWIAPGSPEQNGRHERMHWTLKQETALSPGATLVAQQKAFDHFRYEYNVERPHEALGNDTPASHYHTSARRLPKHLPDITYPTSFAARRVKRTGQISWAGGRIFVSEVLAHEVVGLDEQADGTWKLYFGPLQFGLVGTKGAFVRLQRPLWTPTQETGT